jgi:hypothetical protein
VSRLDPVVFIIRQVVGSSPTRPQIYQLKPGNSVLCSTGVGGTTGDEHPHHLLLQPRRWPYLKFWQRTLMPLIGKRPKQTCMAVQKRRCGLSPDALG